MTVHEQYQNDLKAYIDNELPLLRRLAMRRHVDTCRACREELMQMAQVTEELRADEAHEGVTTGIDSALRARIIDNAGDAVPSQPAPRPIPWKLVTAGAVIGTVVVGSFFGQVTHKSAVPSSAQMPPPSNQQVAKLTDKVRHRPMPGLPNDSQELAHTDDGLSTAHIYDSNGQSKVANGTWATRAPVSGAATNYGQTVTLDASNSSNVTSYMYSPPAHQTLVDGNVTYTVAGATDIDRNVHKEASIGVDVDDPEKRSDDVESTVKGMGGYVASSNLSTNDDGLKTAEMGVKVPVDQFDTFMKTVAHLGTVSGKNVTAEDITEKTSDAHIKATMLEGEASKAEARLKLLGKRSKWDDAETARDLRIQLAQARARLVILKKLGQLSDIDVTLTQKQKPTPPPPSGFLSGMNDTTKSAFGSMMGAIASLASVIIWILIYAPIWIPVALVGRWLYRRYRTSTSQASS